jgi:FkbH-like protein
MNNLPEVSLKSARAVWRDHVSANVGGPVDLAVGIAATFTVDPLIPYLGAKSLKSGILAPAFQNADYNQIFQACLNHQRTFSERPPEVILLLWRIEDLASASDPQALSSAINSFLDVVRHLRTKFSGMIVLGIPPRPRPPEAGLAGFSRMSELESVWLRACLDVGGLCRDLPGIHTVDLELAATNLGIASTLDARKRLLYRQPYTEAFYNELSTQIARLFAVRKLAAKKCLVLDGDNTLWGGIVGEDGPGGVAIGEDFPGSAFRDFQLQIKELQRSGIFIAICSKNNPDDVYEIFDVRQEMVLRKDDFSVACINWTAKSENLKAIAKELNIGLDALVFIDDSEFEIAEVLSQVPQVTALLRPDDLAELPKLLQDYAHLFDRLDITDADRQRVGMMKQETQRRELSQSLAEEDFLASLRLVINIFEASEADLPRFAQLTNKTNQFNVTTKRYSAEEIATVRTSGRHNLYCMSVSDKFGDYGLVGGAIVERRGEVAKFDTLLMSCRVLGRGIETAFISTIMKHQAASGAQEMQGLYRPTSKNMMVSDLFSRHGFCAVTESLTEQADDTMWQLDMTLAPKIQPFLEVRTGFVL